MLSLKDDPQAQEALNEWRSEGFAEQFQADPDPSGFFIENRIRVAAVGSAVVAVCLAVGSKMAGYW